MPKKSYFEGWGYSDTIKLLIKGTKANRDLLFKELKQTFPKDDIEKSGEDTIEAFVYEKQIPTVKKMARLFKMKVAYMSGGTTDEVAKIILEQLGGYGRLVVMTGANNFIALKNGVSFRIKNRKINFVKILLNGKDLYDVTFGKIYASKLTNVKTFNDVYFDELIPIFEKETGMYLKLFKKGGFVSSQNRDMVLSQLKSIHHHEQELTNALKTSGEIESWVLAKVQRATTDLSDVTHYIDGKTEYAKGGAVRKLQKSDAVIYKDETWYVTEKNGVAGIMTFRQGAWGSDYPFIPLSKLDVSTITDMYGNKVEFGKGGRLDKSELTDIRKVIELSLDSDIEADEISFSEYKNFIRSKYFKPIEEENLRLVYEVMRAEETREYAKGGLTDDEMLHKLLFAKGGRTLYSLDQIEYDIEYRNKNGEKFTDTFKTKDEALREIERLKQQGYTITSRYRSFKDDGTFNGFFNNGGMPMPQGVSVADANPYIATAKAVQGIAPQSVSALDQRIASKINPDPNRPVFF